MCWPIIYLISQQSKKRSSSSIQRFQNRNIFTPLSREFYLSKQHDRIHNSKYQSLQRNREKLPAFSHKDMVIELVKNHDIVLISGETG